ncbi:hypothetical protein EA772_05400 [Pedobacter sp. G11]|uniref:hypothetical protein n=1 Tax=Pedobacter sp. G11 TaxID=2482728 RepID=UPI000F5E2B51|nr:hypothetical protein [Pedobacter sp. G11]AZI24808.1 hypothetical protein EA772_05400 [Pedobacter sp. G11]
MKHLLIFITVVLATVNSNAQNLTSRFTLQPEAQHINSRIPRYESLSFFQLERNYLPNSYIKADYVKGKATTTDGWAKGNITIKNEDVVYNNVDLTYNQVNDKLYVKGNKGIVTINKPIKEFTIADGDQISYFRTGFPSVNSNNNNTIYEVLKDGEYKLLKRVEKNVYVTVGYNIVTEKRYDAKVKYFVNTGDKMFEVKPNDESLTEAANKYGLPIGDLVANYKIKNESQLVALIKNLP